MEFKEVEQWGWFYFCKWHWLTNILEILQAHVKRVEVVKKNHKTHTKSLQRFKKIIKGDKEVT